MCLVWVACKGEGGGGCKGAQGELGREENEQHNEADRSPLGQRCKQTKKKKEKEKVQQGSGHKAQATRLRLGMQAGRRLFCFVCVCVLSGGDKYKQKKNKQPPKDSCMRLCGTEVVLQPNERCMQQHKGERVMVKKKKKKKKKVGLTRFWGVWLRSWVSKAKEVGPFGGWWGGWMFSLFVLFWCDDGVTLLEKTKAQRKAKVCERGVCVCVCVCVCERGV